MGTLANIDLSASGIYTAAADTALPSITTEVSSWATFDATPFLDEKGVQLEIDETAVDVTPFMKKWIAKEFVTRVGMKSITFTLLESDYEALQLSLSMQSTSGDGSTAPYTVDVGGATTPTYKAIGIETALGVWYAPKARALSTKAIGITDTEVTVIEAKFKVIADANDLTASFTQFNAA